MQPEITQIKTRELKEQITPPPDHYLFNHVWIHASEDVTIRYRDYWCCKAFLERHRLVMISPDCARDDVIWTFKTREEALQELIKIKTFIEAYWHQKRNRVAVAVPAAIVMDRDEVVDVEAQVAKTE